MISDTTTHAPKQAAPGPPYYNYNPQAVISKRSVSPSAEKSVADAMLSLSAQRPEAPGVSAYSASAYSHQHAEYGGTVVQQQHHHQQHQQLQQHQQHPIVVKPEQEDPLLLQQQQQQQQQEEEQQHGMSRHQRKHREFIPEGNKDETYWSKRRKNNEAAKRSREKRRMNDMAMGERIVELTNENSRLKQEIITLKKSIGWPLDKVFVEQHSQTENEVPISITAAAQQAVEATSVQESSEHPVAPPVPIQVQFSNMPMLIRAQQQEVFSPPSLVSTMQHPGDMAYTSPVGSQVTGDQHCDQPVGTGVYSIEPISPASPRQCASPDSRSDSPHSLKISLSGESSDSDMSDHEDIITQSNMSKASGPMARPLNLSTRQMDEGYSTNDSSSTSDMGPDEKKREFTSIPHKLRHKMTSNEAFIVARQAPYPTSFPAAAAAAAAATTVAASLIDSVSTQEDNSYPLDPLDPLDDDLEASVADSKLDPRYLERRRRNNLAARKCRENRKRMSELRMVKSDVLETENSRLKDEISTLSSEIHSLRGLLDKKKEAQSKGQPFAPPPLEEFTELRD